MFLRPVGGHRLCEGDWRDFSSPGLPGGLSLLSPTLSGRTWCSPLSPLQGGGAWGVCGPVHPGQLCAGGPGTGLHPWNLKLG